MFLLPLLLINRFFLERCNRIMSNTVTLKRSSVVWKVPQTSDLAFGEVALNFADGRLYYRNSSDQIEFFEKSIESSGGFSALEEDTDLGSVGANNTTNYSTDGYVSDGYVSASAGDSNISSFLDAGSINDAEENAADLGFLAITGFINPGILTLPSYDSDSFPPVEPQSQIIYVSDNGTLAFSDGNNWNQFDEVSITGSYNDLSDTPNLATVATTGSYNDLSDTPTSTGVTTGKAIAMAIVFG